MGGPANEVGGPVHIVVCIKQILDPEIAPGRFRVDADAKTVIPVPGLPPVISPFDEQAVEAALRVRDVLGEARITVVSLGPESARSVIKTALSLGADEGVLLTDPAFAGGDGYATALVLSAAIRKLGDYDLVLAGRQAADSDAGVVGCGIAELLGVPCVTFARDVRLDGRQVVVERVLEDGAETVEAPLPAVVTVAHELGSPRHASLRETMRAARKRVTAWTATDLGLDAARVGAAGARLVLERLYVPVNDTTFAFVEGNSPEELAVNLARRLRDAEVI